MSCVLLAGQHQATYTDTWYVRCDSTLWNHILVRMCTAMMVRSCHPHLHSHAIKAFVAAAIQHQCILGRHAAWTIIWLQRSLYSHASHTCASICQVCLQHVRKPSKVPLLLMCVCFSLQHAGSFCRKYALSTPDSSHNLM